MLAQFFPRLFKVIKRRNRKSKNFFFCAAFKSEKLMHIFLWCGPGLCLNLRTDQSTDYHLFHRHTSNTYPHAFEFILLVNLLGLWSQMLLTELCHGLSKLGKEVRRNACVTLHQYVIISFPRILPGIHQWAILWSQTQRHKIIKKSLFQFISWNTEQKALSSLKSGFDKSPSLKF